MISAIVAVTVFAVVVATIVLFAREPGPTPTEIAISYELAWDRLDFDALWTLAGAELRDGLDKKSYVAAKSAAYARRSELRNLVARVDIDDVNVGIAHAMVRTRVTPRSGSVVRNEVALVKRASSWVVTGYEMVSEPSQPV